jgi:hypothetical protein
MMPPTPVMEAAEFLDGVISAISSSFGKRARIDASSC